MSFDDIVGDLYAVISLFYFLRFHADFEKLNFALVYAANSVTWLLFLPSYYTS